MCGLSSSNKKAFIWPGHGSPLTMYSPFAIRCRWMLPPPHPDFLNQMISEKKQGFLFAWLLWGGDLSQMETDQTPIQSHLSDAQKPACTGVDSWLAWRWQHKWDPLGQDEGRTQQLIRGLGQTPRPPLSWPLRSPARACFQRQCFWPNRIATLGVAGKGDEIQLSESTIPQNVTPLLGIASTEKQPAVPPSPLFSPKWVMLWVGDGSCRRARHTISAANQERKLSPPSECATH